MRICSQLPSVDQDHLFLNTIEASLNSDSVERFIQKFRKKDSALLLPLAVDEKTEEGWYKF